MVHEEGRSTPSAFSRALSLSLSLRVALYYEIHADMRNSDDS